MTDEQPPGPQGRSWRERVEGLRQRYQDLPPRTRLMAIGAVAAVAAVVGVASIASRPPELEVLFSELSPDDSGRIIEQLGGLQIPYELQEGGATILVPGDRVHEVRLRLASLGLPSGGDAGFELFDEQRFGESEFSERVKYHRALEGELARTITHLSGVERARVHLVLPHRSLFVTREEGASASVVLHMQPGRRLTQEQARGIVHLIASSVRGLAPESVTIVDGEGRSLTAEPNEAEVASDALAYRRRVERERERAAQELLDTALGPGVAAVRVSADVSFTREERTEERFLPDEVAPRSYQIEEERSNTGEAQAVGIPGAASNLPGGAPAQSGTETQGLVRRSETRNFEISRTTRRSVEPVGRIERLQVAVVVDGIWEGEGAERAFQPRDEEELSRLEDIVARAVGVVPDRGDEISITCVPFATRADDLDAVDPIDELMGPYRRWRPYLPYFAALPFALIGLILLMRWRRRKKKEAAAAQEAEVSARLEGGTEEAKVAGALPSGEDSDEADPEKVQVASLPSADQLRAEIRREPEDDEIPLLAAELASEDPARAARVIRGWLLESTQPSDESENDDADDDASADHAA